jgi:hypothetical protein
MAVNGIEIQVGQTWRTRDGEIKVVIANDGHCRYPWESDHTKSHTDEGLTWFDEENDDDLIELISGPGFVAEVLAVGDSHEALHAADHETITVSSRLQFPEPGLATNPKDAIGSTKLPLHLWPAEATALGCLGMLEGKEKYGRNNYIAGEGVVASIYIDAAKRHIDAWFSGEEVSPDTQNDHLGNALACLAIIVKTRAHGKLIDDRDFAPNPGYRKLVEELTPNVKRLQGLFVGKSPRHFTIADKK